MIKSEKINLRLVQSKDLDELYTNICNLENRGDYFPLTLRGEAQFKQDFAATGFWSEQFGRFIIENKNHEMLGSIYYFKTVPYSDTLELGFILFDKQFHNQGYISEALMLMTDYLFKAKKIHRLQLGILPDNLPSLKVAEKCGFYHEATLKAFFYNDGAYHDIELYVKLRVK